MAGSVPITLDKERQLRFDLNALADADEVAGKSISEFLAGDRVGLSAIRALLWAGLKGEDRRLTVEQAGQLMQDELAKGADSISAITMKIREAMVAAGLFGESETKNGKAEPEKPSGSATG